VHHPHRVVMRIKSSDEEKESILFEEIGYSIKDSKLRRRAITRKAWVNDHGPDNKITNPGLATLGDAVIGLAVVHHFYAINKTPGEISDEKIKRVSRKNHTKIAKKIGLKDCLLLGKCEGINEEWDEGDALGESFEGVIGAVYLDDIKNGGNGITICTEILKRVGLI